ncbi:MAG TPA: serine hydrolase domain-containing protein [Chryseolinea sp.]
MKSLLIIILFLGYGGCEKLADSDKELVPDDIRKIIGEFESELRMDLGKDSIDGSISAAIVSGDNIIWSTALGYADRVNKVPADTSTIYRAGSISKSFTAFLMMRLVEKGTIKLTDPVDLYLPEIRKLRGYSDSTRITFLQLASHTSGLCREPQLEDADVGRIDDWEEKLIASIPTCYFIGRPGSRYEYSNIGFGILGLALSRATGKPFMQLMQNEVFVPLKMRRSFYVIPESLTAKLALGMEGGPTEVIDTESPKAEHLGRGYKVPNGGIYTTPNDLARFMICNLGYKSILTKESLELMQTEKGPLPNKYGLGFMIFQNDQLYVVGHNGKVLGYTSQFAFEKESEYGVILMRNYAWGATDLDKASFILLSKLRKLQK